MSNGANIRKVAAVQAASKKVFSHTPDDPPFPTYTNIVEFTGLGIDVFMDIGVVSPESVQSAMDDKRQPAPPAIRTIDMNVLCRFGMTIQTAIMMHQKLTQLIEATKAQGEGRETETKQG
jgi:hypothetical protein